MKVEKDRVVIFKFSIIDEQGVELESSESEPASYIQGIGSSLPAIEADLEGKEAGYKTVLNLTSEEAFGDYDEELVIEVPLSEFDEEELAVGMEFTSDGDQQEESGFFWRVIKITDNEVSLDANHPYAGKKLTFNIEITDVREATPEELEHGHVID